MAIVERAPAKINLALHVRRRRDDGYHELDTLFAFVRDGDSIELSPGTVDALTIGGPFAAGLGTGTDNLVIRARDAVRAAFDVNDPVVLHLDKRLPVASGIGGGSADAAATLRAMARHHDIPPDDPRLVACAEGLGSDVPACLLGRTARGSGRGERLEPLDPLPPKPCLLVNPGVAVSTAAVFARWDGTDGGPIPTGPALDAADRAGNDLEAPARAAAPVIGDVLERLHAARGVGLVRMSGSGATCFAIFDHVADCADAARTIRTERPDWWCLETVLA